MRGSGAAHRPFRSGGPKWLIAPKKHSATPWGPEKVASQAGNDLILAIFWCAQPDDASGNAYEPEPKY